MWYVSRQFSSRKTFCPFRIELHAKITWFYIRPSFYWQTSLWRDDKNTSVLYYCHRYTQEIRDCVIRKSASTGLPSEYYYADKLYTRDVVGRCFVKKTFNRTVFGCIPCSCGRPKTVNSLKTQYQAKTCIILRAMQTTSTWELILQTINGHR